MTTGPIAALTYAVGEQLNQLAGVRLTRLARAAAPGDAELVVERSLGMAAQGVVVVDGVTYSYGNLVDGALQDLEVTTPQGSFTGVIAPHGLNAVVSDATRNYSALDTVRRSLFVATAEGEDLSLLGRLLGVPREPAVADDAQYRSLIRAIAYNPRTTLQGLTGALDALVGRGNYAVVEDPDNYPSTVLVYLSGEDLVGTQAQGRAFLAGPEQTRSKGDGSLALAGPAVSVGALHLAPVAWYKTFSLSPSLVLVDDSGQIIRRGLVNNSPPGTRCDSPYTYAPGQQYPQLTAPGYYFNDGPVTAAASVRAVARLLVPDAAKLSGDPRTLAVRIRTTAATFAVGAVLAPGGAVGLGLANVTDSAGSLAQGIAATVPAGQFFELALSVTPKAVALRVNGRLVQTMSQGSGTGTAALAKTGLDFGSLNGQASFALLQAAGLDVTDPTDYNSLYDLALPKGPDTLTVSFLPKASDVGRALRVLDGGGASGSQNQARDSYVITSVDPTERTVTVGPRDLGPVNVAGAQVFCSGAEYPLTYPDDLNRQVTLSGSLLGNNGTYTITGIGNEDGTQDLSRPPGAPQVRSQYATLSPAPARKETQVTASLAPNFGSLSARVQLVGAFDSAGLDAATPAFRPRATLPFDPDLYEATVSHVLSAQVFDDLGSVNYRLGNDPLRYLIWPLYLTDPTFFVQTYLQDMLAAGVRLKIMAGLKDFA